MSHYEISVIEHRDGRAPLQQTVTCDAELAVSWLTTVAREIADSVHPESEPAWKQLGDPRAGGKAHLSTKLRTGRHPMSLNPE